MFFAVVQHLVIDLVGHDSDVRVIGETSHQFVDLGARCGEPSGRGMELSERMTHQILADLAGAHRATVTTLLNDWLYEGVLGVTSDNRLTLRNPSELRILAGYHGAQ